MLKIPGYALEGRLGQGSSGIVYRAQKRDSRQRVALRILNPALPLAARRAMLADAQALVGVQHPHLIAIHQAGEIHTQQYVAMEYLPGVSLRQCLQQPLSIPQVLGIGRAIADALHELHSRGLVHRDIRPRNVLFRHDGNPVLTDISSQPLPVGGIHRYLSPEQRAATCLNPASDLYALGLVLLEMLGLEFPGHRNPLMLSPEQEPLRPLLELLLAEDPTSRYASAEAFIDDLDHCLQQHPRWQMYHPPAILAQWGIGERTADWAWPATSVAAGLLGAALLSGQLLSSQYPQWRWDLSLDWSALTRLFSSQALQLPATFAPGVDLLAHRLPDSPPQTPAPPDSPLVGREGGAPYRWPVRLAAQAQYSGASLGQWQPRLVAVSLQAPPGQAVSLRDDQEPLLQRLWNVAQDQLQNQRLTTPLGDNAVESYRAMLAIKPNDPRALAGLEQVTERYLSWAQRARQRGQYQDSLDRIERGLSVDPQHQGLLSLRQQVKARWQQAQVELAMPAQRVTIPGGPFKSPASSHKAGQLTPSPDLWNRSSR